MKSILPALRAHGACLWRACAHRYLECKFAVAYSIFATAALFMLAAVMPPFQNADEQAHMARADQISHLRLLGENLASGASGGHVDSGIPLAAAAFNGLPFHRERKLSRAMYAPQDWGERIEAGFPNTDIYPPFFYLPAAAGIAAARAAGLTVLHGLTMARIAGGLVSIATATLAIILADDAAIWLFAVLLLPMSLCLTAALSQDAPMLATTALAVVLCRRAAHAPATPALVAAASLPLALVAMARPPYVAFGLLLLAARAPWRHRLAAAGAVLAATLAWSTLSAALTRLPNWRGGTVNPALQLHGLMEAPWHAVIVAGNTGRLYGGIILQGFIGYPGWLDVDLPSPYFPVAIGMLAAAGAVALRGADLSRRAALLVPATILIAAVAIGFLQYMTWTIVGAPAVDGIQGRYFLAPALLLAALPPRSPAAVPRWSYALQAGVLAFPIASIPVTLHAIAARYYF